MTEDFLLIGSKTLLHISKPGVAVFVTAVAAAVVTVAAAAAVVVAKAAHVLAFEVGSEYHLAMCDVLEDRCGQKERKNYSHTSI